MVSRETACLRFFLTIVVTIFAEDQIDNRMQRFEGAPQQLHVRFSHWKVDPPKHSVNIQVVSHLKMLSIFFLQKNMFVFYKSFQPCLVPHFTYRVPGKHLEN